MYELAADGGKAAWARHRKVACARVEIVRATTQLELRRRGGTLSVRALAVRRLVITLRDFGGGWFLGLATSRRGERLCVTFFSFSDLRSSGPRYKYNGKTLYEITIVGHLVKVRKIQKPV